MEFDVLIKNGLVYDGTDSGPTYADIGVKGDIIAAMGKLSGAAKTVIQADGCIVTPGFIDVHTHTDLLDLSSMGSRPVEEFNNLYQGVTTVISGLCGIGATHTSAWFAFLRKSRFSVNVSHLIPHGALRAELFGEETQALTHEQMSFMKERVREEMTKGAIGLSTGLIYTPGSCADRKELIELCKVVKECDGLYVSHVRGEDGESILQAYKEAITIGHEASLPIHISHMKLLKPYKDVTVDHIISIVEEARKEGLDVTGDQYPYAACATQLSGLLPPQYQSSLGIKTEYKSDKGKTELEKASMAFLSDVLPHEILIVNNREEPSMNGKYLDEIASDLHVDPLQAFLHLIISYDDVNTAFFIVHEEIMRALMQKEYVFTGSDGLSPIKAMDTVQKKDHPRKFGTFAKKISHFALGEKAISLNQAIMSMTSRPAKKFKMKGRGELKIGNFADIAVIDLSKYRDKATFDNADSYADGVRYVLVNGVMSLEEGKVVNERGGRPILR